MASVPDDLLEQVIDLYFYEPGCQGVVPGGAGAYCYIGSSELIQLGGTDLADWVDGLAQCCGEVEHGEDFRVQYQGTVWRGCRDLSSEHGTHVSLRRLPLDCPELADIKMDCPMTHALLTSPWLNEGGLVFVSGLTGQGKTTTAAAMLRSRLERYSGRGVTIVDVPEAPLEGIWGAGSCRQIVVNYRTDDRNLAGFPGAVRRAYRSFPATRPAILLVGEVRDVETASEVVKAAANGMLVISTVHSYDPITALMRVAGLASHGIGDAASMSLGQALRMVVHQQLTLSPTDKGWGRGRYEVSTLISTGATSSVANLIRRQQYHELARIIEQQKIKLRLAGEKRQVPAEFLRSLGD